MADRREKRPESTRSRPAAEAVRDREARLVEALRRNLRRRKAQRDARATETDRDDPGVDPKDESE